MREGKSTERSGFIPWGSPFAGTMYCLFNQPGLKHWLFTLTFNPSFTPSHLPGNVSSSPIHPSQQKGEHHDTPKHLNLDHITTNIHQIHSPSVSCHNLNWETVNPEPVNKKRTQQHVSTVLSALTQYDFSSACLLSCTAAAAPALRGESKNWLAKRFVVLPAHAGTYKPRGAAALASLQSIFSHGRSRQRRVRSSVAGPQPAPAATNLVS